MLCNGRESESYVDTRMRIYNGLKQKSSLCLSSHVDSVSKAIKRVHHQTSTWLQCTSEIISNLPSQKMNGSGQGRRRLWFLYDLRAVKYLLP